MTDPGLVVDGNLLRSNSPGSSVGYDADSEGYQSDDTGSISTSDNEVGRADGRNTASRADRRLGVQMSGQREIPENRIFWNAMERLAASNDPAARTRRDDYIARWTPIVDAYVDAMRNYSDVTGDGFESVWQSYGQLNKLFEEIVRDPAFPRFSARSAEFDIGSRGLSMNSDSGRELSRMLNESLDEIYTSPDEQVSDFELANTRSEMVDHSRKLPRSQEEAKRDLGKAQNTLLRLLKEQVENPAPRENIDDLVKLARDQTYWAIENLEFWNHHTAYSSDRKSQSDSDGKSENEVAAHPEVKRLSDLLEEKEWYRLYIHPQDHAAARERFPDDPGKYYDQTDPGYQESMMESYRQVLDSKDLASIELNYETYSHWHDLVNSHLKNKAGATGSEQQRDANAVTSHPIRAPRVSSTLLTEKVGDKQLVGDLGANSVTWLYEGSIMSNFSADEIPGMLESVFDRYNKEIEQATDASDKFHAIGRAVRTVQTIHPNSDTNSRLNIYLMTPALLQKNGFKPVVIQDLHTMFHGGRTLDQIARALQEGQDVDLLTDNPPTLIADSFSDVQVVGQNAQNVEPINNDIEQLDLEINFEYESSESDSSRSKGSLNGQVADQQLILGDPSQGNSAQPTSETPNPTSPIPAAASMRLTNLTDGSGQNVANQATQPKVPPLPSPAHPSAGPTR